MGSRLGEFGREERGAVACVADPGSSSQRRPGAPRFLLPAELGGEAQGENKRKTAPWLSYSNNAIAREVGTGAQRAVAAEGVGGGGGGGGEAEGVSRSRGRTVCSGPGANKQCLDYRYTGEGRIASVVRSRW